MVVVSSNNVLILDELLKENKKEIQLELKKLNIKKIKLNPTGNREITLELSKM
ncbi:hypothetical protein HOK00_00630 [bacterium]|nr:hypothetical protein [bacterium]